MSVSVSIKSCDMRGDDTLREKHVGTLSKQLPILLKQPRRFSEKGRMFFKGIHAAHICPR